MPKKHFTCGVGEGPVSGQTTFTHEFLKTCQVNFIIVNNANENQQDPDPDFTHNYIMGNISRAPNVWFTGDKLMLDYTLCQNCE